ncbi:MAG TPA: hypothetical protein VLB00_13235 [Gemmatimonadales bacterium]|nr:hypothetical protein [Gemmatimonadales bacterium]
MMDEREDRLDEWVRDAARDYNAPPPTPRAEMWEAIQAGRRAARVAPRPLSPVRTPFFRYGIGIAALLALGIAIGRITVPQRTEAPAATGSATAQTTTQPAPDQPPVTATPNPGSRSPAPSSPHAPERGEVAALFATGDHLTQVETFLTEFGTRAPATDFAGQAQDLLTNTRLLLDSKRVADVRTRKLLEDLELVLAQIATLNPRQRRQDLDLIADGLAQSHLRTRLRNAIPAGSAIRL